MTLIFASRLSGKTIVILIGEDEHRFVVEKDRICVKSKFIRAACASDRWLEGRDMVVRLPEVRSRTLFKRYQSWIRTDTVTVKETTSETAEERNMKVPIRLHLLGDFLDDVRLRNVTIRALTKYGACPSIKHRNFIFEQTTPASPLIKWTVETIVNLAHQYKSEAVSVLYDKDLALQIATILMRRR